MIGTANIGRSRPLLISMLRRQGFRFAAEAALGEKLSSPFRLPSAVAPHYAEVLD